MLKAGVAYSQHKIEADRSVAFPGLSHALKTDYDANTFQAFGEISHQFDINGTGIEPFANLALVRFHADRFAEQGGSAALRVGNDTTTTAFTTLGLRASAPVTFASMDAEVNFSLGWQHAFGDTKPTVSAAFDSGSFFEVAGSGIARDSAIVKAGFDVVLSQQTTLGLEYHGRFGSGDNQNAAKAKLSINF